jgi:hypothetical protein
MLLKHVHRKITANRYEIASENCLLLSMSGASVPEGFFRLSDQQAEWTHLHPSGCSQNVQKTCPIASGTRSVRRHLPSRSLFLVDKSYFI